ncbi:hypothetical protein BDN67DRAFT_974349 [Paxillus ammoniavirescens]|nr:hypothetical protein BDN67DRAFT_974349 [Paxillus ammoniavirescens]
MWRSARLSVVHVHREVSSCSSACLRSVWYVVPLELKDIIIGRRMNAMQIPGDSAWILGTRILFDLREAGKTGLIDVFSVSNMHFASAPMYNIRERSRHAAEGVEE